MLRLKGQAHSDSVVEMFLQRLDEQGGLEISSPEMLVPMGKNPVSSQDDRLIVDILWTQLCGACTLRRSGQGAANRFRCQTQMGGS